MKQKVVKIAGGPGARAQKAGAPRIRWHSGVQPKAAQKNCRPRCRWSCLTTCRNKTGAMLTPCYSHANSSALPRSAATSPRGPARPPARRGETAGGQCRCGSPGHWRPGGPIGELLRKRPEGTGWKGEWAKVAAWC